MHCTLQESNLRPFGPEPNALSPELRVPNFIPLYILHTKILSVKHIFLFDAFYIIHTIKINKMHKTINNTFFILSFCYDTDIKYHFLKFFNYLIFIILYHLLYLQKQLNCPYEKTMIKNIKKRSNILRFRVYTDYIL